MGKNRLPWKSLAQFIACVFDLLVVSQYVTFLVEMLNTTDGVILVGMHIVGWRRYCRRSFLICYDYSTFILLSI